MSASSLVAVMVGDEILAKSHESDLTKVEGSTSPLPFFPGAQPSREYQMLSVRY
jgi:hypothetical protein